MQRVIHPCSGLAIPALLATAALGPQGDARSKLSFCCSRPLPARRRQRMKSTPVCTTPVPPAITRWRCTCAIRCDNSVCGPSSNRFRPSFIRHRYRLQLLTDPVKTFDLREQPAAGVHDGARPGCGRFRLTQAAATATPARRRCTWGAAWKRAVSLRTIRRAFAGT